MQKCSDKLWAYKGTEKFPDFYGSNGVQTANTKKDMVEA
jgi:hypothetical protein